MWEKLETGEENPTVTVKTRATAVDLIENVISFKLKRYVANGNTLDDSRTGDTQAAPYLLEIEVRVLDSRESFELWQEANAAEKDRIFTEHGYTFHRAVLLGKKGE